MNRSTLIAGLATAITLAASTLTAEAGPLNRSNVSMSDHRSGIVTIDYRRNGGYFHRPHFRPHWPMWRPRHHYWR
jgi:hypothetical protein